MPGHDAIVVTLGISEPTLSVRFRGARGTPNDVRSRATAIIVDVARHNGIKRVVVQSSYGVGPTRSRLGWLDRLFVALLIKPQLEDTEIQERHIRGSDLDWTIVQPVFLTDKPSIAHFLSTDGTTRKRSVSRRGLAQVHADLAEGLTMVGQTVAVSG